jgi:hypothetical protein
MKKAKPNFFGFIYKLKDIFPSRESGSAYLPYAPRNELMSREEHDFYRALQRALSGKLEVFPKVSLMDIFFVTQRKNNASHYRKLGNGHIDFLLCRTGSLKPVGGIILEEKPGLRDSDGDLHVDALFEAACLPLLRFKYSMAYSLDSVKDEIDRLLLQKPGQDVPVRPQKSQQDNNEAFFTPRRDRDKNRAAVPAAKPSARSMRTVSCGPPVCPRCKVPMIQKSIKRGTNAGKAFYTCPNYPDCREFK